MFINQTLQADSLQCLPLPLAPCSFMFSCLQQGLLEHISIFHSDSPWCRVTFTCCERASFTSGSGAGHVLLETCQLCVTLLPFVLFCEVLIATGPWIVSKESVSQILSVGSFSFCLVTSGDRVLVHHLSWRSIPLLLETFS